MNAGSWLVGGAGVAIALVAVAAVGTERWIIAGYSSAGVGSTVVAADPADDEREWLRPAVADGWVASSVDPVVRLRLAGILPPTPSGRAYDVVRVIPLPPIPGEPLLLLVTARDPDAPERTQRLIVEADGLSQPPVAKSL